MELVKKWIEKLSEQSSLPLSRIGALALLMHLMSVWVSISYHHPDEHFQILEFANYKLGKSQGEDLPWEFREQMRPAIQPAMVVGLVQVCEAVGVRSPFTWALLLRLFTMLAALGTVLWLGKSVMRELETKKARQWFWLGSLFFWFMPYLHVRFTSENVGGILFTIAVCLLAYRQRQQFLTYLGVGFLLGMAVFIRFQLGFAILGIGAWLLWVKRPNLFAWAALVSGGLTALAINLGVDYWFYGEWVFSPYDYFRANIIEDKASHFGVSPWYYYVPAFLLRVLPPLSLLLLVAFFGGLIKNKQSIWLWSFVPFLLAHMAVGHKELRFLYPYLYYFPVAIAVAVDHWWPTIQAKGWKQVIYRMSLWQNIALLFFLLVPFVHQQVGFNEYYLQYLYQYGETHKEVALLSVDDDPYQFYDLQMNFYKSNKIDYHRVADLEGLNNWLDQHHQGREVLLYWRGFDSPPALAGYETRRLHRSFPEWARHITMMNFQEGVPTRGLYRVVPLKTAFSPAAKSEDW